MANLIDLRRRIRSIKNTQQITKAMKMVAAAKLRRAQDAIMATRPYALELQKVTGNLSSGGTGDYEHPLMSAHEGEGKILLAVVTGDKGLCGSFNSNVIRRAETFLREHEGETVDLLLLGRRGSDYFARRRTKVRNSFRSLFTNVSYEDAQGIGDDVIESFTSGEYSQVFVLYNQFVSVLTQNLTLEQVLPLSTDLGEEGDEGRSQGEATDYLYEPSPEAILDALLPRFVIFQFYRALLESQAAEHGARMTAMDNATKNASELIESLTLSYNRQRQAAITTELIEVVSGANALDG